MGTGGGGAEMRICIIFDKVSRGDQLTTGTYLERAFQRLGHSVIHINPTAGAIIPEGMDFYMVVDDGIPYTINPKGKRMAYWAIDTHIAMDMQVQKSSNAEWIFAAQYDGGKALSELSNRRVSWLPLACDPDIHSAPNAKEKLYDISFIGNVRPNIMSKRIDVIDAVFKEVPDFIYGQRPIVEAIDLFGKSRIVLNCSIGNDLNMRVFEGLCSGSMLLTDKIPNIMRLFDNLHHLVMYDDADGAAKLARYYLENPDEREEIAKKGRACVIENHTYLHRAKQILETIGV